MNTSKDETTNTGVSEDMKKFVFMFMFALIVLVAGIAIIVNYAPTPERHQEMIHNDDTHQQQLQNESRTEPQSETESLKDYEQMFQITNEIVDNLTN